MKSRGFTGKKQIPLVGSGGVAALTFLVASAHHQHMANDLIKEYVAARNALHQEQARITQRLAEIDQALGSGDAPVAKPAPVPKAAGPGRRGRGGNKLTMREAVTQVLQGTALKKAGILDALKASSYRFNTKNPANSLGVLLYGNKQLFKNVKGVFSLAKASASSAKAAPAKSAKPKKKRTMSPEARAKIAAAQKKRWAKVRRAAKKG
ncbi:MAG: hypothetical protein ACI8QF_000617 [Limisphaerales bacterium]